MFVRASPAELSIHTQSCCSSVASLLQLCCIFVAADCCVLIASHCPKQHALLAIKGPHAEWLARGVLAQCRALVHLDLSGNWIEAGGAESLAGVCRSTQAVLPQPPSYFFFLKNGRRTGSGVRKDIEGVA